MRPATGVGADARCPGRAPARRLIAINAVLWIDELGVLWHDYFFGKREPVAPPSPHENLPGFDRVGVMPGIGGAELALFRHCDTGQRIRLVVRNGEAWWDEPDRFLGEPADVDVAREIRWKTWCGTGRWPDGH